MSKQINTSHSKIFLIVGSFAESLINFRGHLIVALQVKGLQLHVAAPGLVAGNKTYSRLQAMGVCVHDVALSRKGINPFSDLQTFFSLYKLIKKIRPDYILCYTIKPVIYGTLSAWLLGISNRFALITGLGYAFQDVGNHKYLKYFIQRVYGYVISKATKTFFQNPDDQILFKSRGLISKYSSSCIVNGSGVDLDYFDVVPFPEGINFLMISRLLGNKGVREFVAAAKKVNAVFPEVRFTLVGWLDKGADAIRQSELDGWVESKSIDYLGAMADVRPAIGASNVYVLPSYREGTSRTILEAMAMGRPIITTDVPGCRDAVIEGYNGTLVCAKSIDDLVEAMTKFILNPHLIHRMGAHSRKLSIQKYDVHKVNDFMLREMGL